MKKRLIAITCLAIGTLFAVSCNKGQQTPADHAGDVSSDSAVQLHYNCETNANDFPTEVTLYEAEYWKSTDYDLEADLLKGEIVDHKVWAVGSQTIANYQGKDEYLYFHDGGEAFYGEWKNVVDGGFTYVDTSAGDWYSENATDSLVWDHLNTISGGSIEPTNPELWGDEDLAFRSFQEVEDDLLQQFQKLDLNMQVVEKYTVNVSPEQNCYLLMFTEMIDEIPLVPYFYTEGDVQRKNWLLNCNASVYVGEDGIMDAYVTHLVQPTQELEKVEIISLNEAKSALEERMKAKYTSDVEVEHMGLYYIGMPGAEKESFRLTPFWLFCVSSEVTGQTKIGTEIYTRTTTEVCYEVLNAVDGEWLQH